jgi:HEAT repeat protein
MQLIEVGDQRAVARLYALLPKLNIAADKRMPILMEALQHEAASVRTAAARAISSLGAAAEPAVPLLVAHLSTLGPGDHSAATTIEAIAALGPAASAARPVLEKFFSLGEGSYVRTRAAIALVSIGHDGARITSFMRSILDASIQERDAWCRERNMGDVLGVLRLAGDHRPTAERLLPQLLTHMRGGQTHYRLTTAAALYHVGLHKDEARTMLLDALASSCWKDRKDAVAAVAPLATEDPFFMAALRKAAHDRDPDVREFAQRRLDAMGG